MDDLLSLMSALPEEVGRLEKSEKEMNLQKHSLAFWRWKQEQKTRSRGSCVFFPQQAEDSSLKGRVSGGKSTFRKQANLFPAYLTFQVSLYNRIWNASHSH